MSTIPPTSTHSISTRHWSLEGLLKISDNFRLVARVPLSVAKSSLVDLDKPGDPLIIEGLHEHPAWPKDMFNVDWLSHYGPKDIVVRNIYDLTDREIPFDCFIDKCRSASVFAEPEEPERLYGKDAECPPQWTQWLHEANVIPRALLPEDDGNLLHQQPQSLRVETLMCYLGIGDTYTPCHKDLCASSGQNLMCYTENAGSSFWLMTKSSDADKVSKYFHRLKEELDHESYVITIDKLAKAPFDVFIAEQKLGDLVLVPPRSCHQVINYGGITIKTSWSRMTLKGLETAYYHELPVYQRVCRPEIYRVKSTIYHTLILHTEELGRLPPQSRHTEYTKLADLKKLVQLYDALLVDEYSPDHHEMYCLHNLEGSHSALGTTSVQVICDFCGADIFQSFFECCECVHSTLEQPVAHGDGYVICGGCYVEGRSCNCDNMDPIQCRPFTELLNLRTRAARVLSANELLWNSEDHFNTGTFKAACILQKLKKDKREFKTCSVMRRNYSSHSIPSAWALNCKKCHRSKCFRHILTEHKLHAIDALLAHSGDVSHGQHHSLHMGSSKKYENGLVAFQSAHAEGSEPDVSHRRAYNAITYSYCKPSNPTFARLGYYDQVIADVVTFDQQDEYSTTPEQTGSSSSRSSPKRSNFIMTSEAAIEVSKKSQHSSTDYAGVPSASYNILKQPQLAQSKASGHHLVLGHEDKQPSTPRKRLRPEHNKLSPEEEKRLGRRSTLPKGLHFKKKTKMDTQSLIERQIAPVEVAGALGPAVQVQSDLSNADQLHGRWDDDGRPVLSVYQLSEVPVPAHDHRPYNSSNWSNSKRSGSDIHETM